MKDLYDSEQMPNRRGALLSGDFTAFSQILHCWRMACVNVDRDLLTNLIDEALKTEMLSLANLSKQE